MALAAVPATDGRCGDREALCRADKGAGGRWVGLCLTPTHLLRRRHPHPPIKPGVRVAKPELSRDIAAQPPTSARPMVFRSVPNQTVWVSA